MSTQPRKVNQLFAFFTLLATDCWWQLGPPANYVTWDNKPGNCASGSPPPPREIVLSWNCPVPSLPANFLLPLYPLIRYPSSISFFEVFDENHVTRVGTVMKEFSSFSSQIFFLKNGVQKYQNVTLVLGKLVFGTSSVKKKNIFWRFEWEDSPLIMGHCLWPKFIVCWGGN